MRLIIIGAVAGGTAAAAKARRTSEEAEIVVYEKDKAISYAGCGMPYYLGQEVHDESKLAPRTTAFFLIKHNIVIKTEHEVLAVDSLKKEVQVKNLKTGDIFIDHYDRLILATGANSFIPSIKGANLANVFYLRTLNDMEAIEHYLKETHPKKVAIIGSGFIGLEMAESLSKRKIAVTMIEKLPQVAPSLDEDMAIYVQEELERHKVVVLTNQNIKEITPEGILLEDNNLLAADFILMTTGARPNIELAQSFGVKIGSTHAIQVDARMQTNIPDVYACGDCIEEYSSLTGKHFYRPLGSTANKTGRIAGENALGGQEKFKGVLGTSIFKVFDLTVGISGISEKELAEENINYQIAFNLKPEKPEYMGGKDMVIKAIARQDNGQLLGVQIVGGAGVDKRLDVLAMALTFKATVSDLANLDLAYAPPFSTAKDPVIYTGMILENAIFNNRRLLLPKDLYALQQLGKAPLILDIRPASDYAKSHIDGAINIPQDVLRQKMVNLDKQQSIVTYCGKGVMANAAQNVLLNNGFTQVFNLAGGMLSYNAYLASRHHK